MDAFFTTITWGGSLLVLLPVSALLGFLLCLRKRFIEALLLIVGLCGTSLCAYGLKLIVARPRPEAVALLVPMPPGYSFPSAHSAQVFAFTLACVLIFNREVSRPIGAVLWSGLGLLAVLVGISRVYLQVHYISDVLAGAVLGMAVVSGLRWLLNSISAKG